MSQGNQNFQPLSSEDVISFIDPQLTHGFWGMTTTMVDELRKRIPAICGVTDLKHSSYKWCNDGIEAKVLFSENGGGWKKGRLRLSIEFVPDEPETIPADRPIEPSLDSFRESP